MSSYVAARGAGRSFPIIPRTVSIYSNNYRKLHGLPMTRSVHLRKIEKRKLNGLISEYNLIKLCERGPLLSPDIVSYIMEHFYHEPIIKIDMPSIEFEKPEIDFNRLHMMYGQKLINQKSVITFTTSADKEDKRC